MCEWKPNEREKIKKERIEMISSVLYFCWRILMIAFNIIKFIYSWTYATSIRIILAFPFMIYVLCRYFRLKQPNLPTTLENAICGNQHGCNSMEWWPIANRAAGLDSVENSRTAIEKVGTIKIEKANSQNEIL